MLKCESYMVMKANTERIAEHCQSALRRMSQVQFYLAYRQQPKALPLQKQQLSPTPPKPWPAVPWSGAAVSPPVPSLLEVMLQEAERETQVSTAPLQPPHHANESSGQHRKCVGRRKSTSSVSRCVPAVLFSGVRVVFVQHSQHYEQLCVLPLPGEYSNC